MTTSATYVLGTAEMATRQTEELAQLARLIRVWMLKSTHGAASGHPTSGMSATELMTDLFFGGTLRYDKTNPDHPNNDRVIFSKGHASPLLYALWAAAGVVPEDELMTYRQYQSRLEGHPTSRFSYAEAATGSLGQGLSIGLGMALAAKHLDQLDYRTFVLLGDSEMAEGSNWEAIQLAAHYQLDNLVGIIDVNRLGQRGETMYGHDIDAYRKRIEPFGWRTILVEDGHDHEQVLGAFEQASESEGRPVMLIARTIKGQGVSFLADTNGRHGKALKDDELQKALEELGEVDTSLRGSLVSPEDRQPASGEGAGDQQSRAADGLAYKIGEEVATRAAYGSALKRIAGRHPNLVALDGEVSNSTHAEDLRDDRPDRFFEMFIAEQNMVGTATGLALRGKVPFVSTFAAFFTRAFDQIRMSRHSDATIKFVGSHAGVSIGEDGPSQMGLEDIAMFRSVPDSVVLYPSDAVSTERLVEAMAQHPGIAYLRATRGKTPVIYRSDEPFPIGGAKVVRTGEHDQLTVVAAGITLHEAIKAYEQLRDEEIPIRVVDLYSVKPLCKATLRAAARETGRIITVEDHYSAGGIGEAVCQSLSSERIPIRSLAVKQRPRSGDSETLMDASGISARKIVQAVHELLESTDSEPGGPRHAPRSGKHDDEDVQTASEESFPASDSPSWTSSG